MRRLDEPAALLRTDLARLGNASWVVTRGLAAIAEGSMSNARWVDLDPAASLDLSLDQLAHELLEPGEEPFVAFREGQRYVAARERAALSGQAAEHDMRSIEELRSCEPTARRQRILEAICSELERTLRLPAHAIELDRPLVSFGLDSLMAIQLKNRVEGFTGVSISVAKLLEGRTAKELAAEIDESLSSGDHRQELGNGIAPNGAERATLGSQHNGDAIDRAPFGLGNPDDGIDDLSELELDLLIDELLVKNDEHD